MKRAIQYLLAAGLALSIVGLVGIAGSSDNGTIGFGAMIGGIALCLCVGGVCYALLRWTDF